MSFRWNYLVRKANSAPSSVATASVLCWRRRGPWKGLFLYHIYASLFCIRQMDEKIEDGSCDGVRRWWGILSLCWRVYWDDHRSWPALASFRQIFSSPKANSTENVFFHCWHETFAITFHSLQSLWLYRFTSSCDAFNKIGIHLIASTSDSNATRTDFLAFHFGLFVAQIHELRQFVLWLCPTSDTSTQNPENFSELPQQHFHNDNGTACIHMQKEINHRMHSLSVSLSRAFRGMFVNRNFH